MSPSFPPRRSSDLQARAVPVGAPLVPAERIRRRFRGRDDRIFRRDGPALTGHVEPDPISGVIDDERHLRDRGTLSRSEEHTSELQSLMRISYAVFCLTKKKQNNLNKNTRTN